MIPARKTVPALTLSCVAAAVASFILAQHGSDRPAPATGGPASGTQSQPASNIPGYWTTGRMRNAQPMPMPTDQGTPPRVEPSEPPQAPTAARPPQPAP